MPLVALSRSPAPELPPGAYDVRGWPVRTLVDDERAGTVHDLLLDAQGIPRYLDVDLGPLRRHVLLPIGQARADPRRRCVWVPGMTRAQLRRIPAYGHDLPAVTRPYEYGILEAYRSALAGRSYRPRPAYAGTVYGPSELESPVRVERRPTLAPLRRLPDYRVAEGEPDPRGWAVHAADGARVGRVEELLAEPAARLVRALVCALDEPAGRRVVVPIEPARLEPGRRRVRLDALSAAAVRALPDYPGDELTPDQEAALRAFLDAGAASRFYEQPSLDPRTFFGPAA